MARTFTKAELMQLWIDAGGSRETADVASAIALAESGGRADARNSIGATGLWQIYNGPNTSITLKEPTSNARAAVAKWKAAKGFTPWTVYTGADTGPGGGPGPKTYTKYLDSKTQPAPFLNATVGAAAQTGLNESQDSNLLSPLFSGAVKALVWVVLILGGATLVVLGAGKIAVGS